MSAAPPELKRLSLNQMTIDQATLKEAVDCCVRQQIPWFGAWRHKITEGPGAAGHLIQDAGLRVSSLCRGGYFPAPTKEERRKRIENNFRAVDEAAALGTNVLVLVNGPAPDRDLDTARQMVVDGIAEVAPYAKKCGIKLGIEPLHPMFAADRSVVVLLAQANDIAAMFEPELVGVVIDVYHVWWDPDVYRQIERARGRILGFHLSDWIVPPPDFLKGRGMMGDGVIEIRRLRTAIDEAGYTGPIEVEIFNESLWNTPPDDVLALMKQAYLSHC